MRRLLAALAIAAAGVAGAGEVAEPDGYRLNQFRAPVPATVLDAEVLDTEAARTLWEAGEAVWLDVYPKPIRPENLPEGTLWIEPKRETIPGAVWLPNTGYGKLTPDTALYLETALAELTGGDRETRVVFFCLADCWMSWNAARRAILELGYEDVAWYPDGTDGWEAAGYPLDTVEARP